VFCEDEFWPGIYLIEIAEKDECSFSILCCTFIAFFYMEESSIGFIEHEFDSEFFTYLSVESIERRIVRVSLAHLASREFSPEWESGI
jgi:hypothetical protein